MKRQYKRLLDEIKDGNECVLVSKLDKNNGGILKKEVFISEDINNLNKGSDLNDDLGQGIFQAMDTGNIISYETEDNKVITIEPFIPKPRLFVFGGGHVSKPIVELAAKSGFSVTIIDDRPFFANENRFPDAGKVICESFEESFKLIEFRSTDFVVIVTRGHRYDGIILRQVLNYDLNYIGMIGSRRRVRGMMDQLSQEGFSQENLSRICAPIGLDIGAITPYEIAISVAGQLVSYKNKGLIDSKGRRKNLPELDMEVMESIMQPSDIPQALITIISAKGSVPRKAGAKMISYYDGRTIGSIGGGCSEAGVLTEARNVMDRKGFSIVEVDMTGEVAESNGMVCGGMIHVLVEVF